MSDRTPRQPKTTQQDNAFYAQCLRYIDGDLNEQEFAAFQDQLDTDQKLRKQYVELNVLCEWIAEASDAEHANDALTMAELYTRSRLTPGPASTQPNTREVFSLMGDLAMQSLRTRAGMIGSVAAVLLLGTALYLSFIGLGTEPSTQEITNNTATESHIPAESAQPILRDQAVATLTATHNATWAEGALAPGSRLKAGQTLTLTAGFAEITTARGAVAILQAPATIELIDSNNALHLHTGKLVGICETESSKGFLVRTPHMDITDLGTRFGVDASTTYATEVHVFEGEVRATQQPRQGAAAIEQRLTEKDAIRATSTGQGFAAIDHDDTGFAALTTFAQSIVDHAAAEVGIAAMSGQLRVADGFTGHAPADWPSGDVARIFEEHRNHALAFEISTTLSTPGTYRNFNTAESDTVSAATVIRSYILILKPGSSDGPIRAQGQVTFEGEVLGVIANERDWRVFTNAVPGSFYPNLEEQILINGGADGDYITLEPDGRSLSFGYAVSTGAADTVRVIVREPADAPN